MSVATVSDVAVTIGRPITSDLETAQVEQWLNHAEMQIRLRLGDVSLLDQEALIYVESEAVALKVKNPDGKKSEAIDDYNYGRFDDAARGQVFILPEWWHLLTPTRPAGAFSIGPVGAVDAGPTDSRAAVDVDRWRHRYGSWPL